MKIAVYAIAKNEQHHVARFMSTLGEADAVYVLDTGSTDDTVKLLREAGANVTVQAVTPWRFDVGRNLSLDLVPADVDVCVTLDLDELMLPGWRAKVEQAWTAATTNLQYNYVWSEHTDGSPAVSFLIDKIHRRHGFRWVNPCHEVLQYDGQTVYTRCDIEVRHYQDKSKDRKSYLPLLELAVQEQPNSDRNSHYLAREYMMFDQPAKAIAEFERHLSLPTAVWDVERAASMRYLARCSLKLGKHYEARQWALRACAETPFEREPWWELAKTAYALHDWSLLYLAATTALQHGKQGERYVADSSAWSYGPYDFAAIGAHHTGRAADAVKYGELAVQVATKHGMFDELDRLKTNLQFYNGEKP